MTAGQTNLLAAIEQVSGRILGDNEPAVLSFTDGIADGALNDIAQKLVANAPSGGLKSFEWAPIKGDILASVPGLDADMNAKIKTMLDGLDSYLESA